MRYINRRALLGTVLSLFIFCKQVPKEPDFCTFYVTEQEEITLPDSVTITCKPLLYTSNMTTSRPATTFDIVCAYIHNNNFCKWYYDMTVHEIERLMKVSYERIVSEILKLDHLSSKQMTELWCLYKRGCHKQSKVDECQKYLLAKLQQRAENYKEEQEQKDELKKQKVVEISRLQQVYHEDILQISDQSSTYIKDRQLALQKTKDQNYKRYEQTRELDEQAVGFCIAKNIDYKKLQCSKGTAMQQQLYNEVADCYKKIAQWFCQPSFSESILAHQSLEFAQCVSEATEAEAMQLAVALSDMAHCCADTACSILAGMQDAVAGVVNTIADPVGTAMNLGCCLGKVMNYVAEAMVYADSESLGWSQYAQVLEQEHQYDGKYAQQVIDTLQDWVVHSSTQEKIRAGTRCVIDGVLYGNLCKLLSHTSKACCGLIAEVSELRFLGEFTDIYAEYGLATELGEIGLRSMEDFGLSILKSEAEIISNSKIIMNSSRAVPSSSVENKIVFQAEKYKNWKPKEVDTRCLLDKNLKIAVDAEKEAARIRKLSDGRVRFYQAEDLASTPGPTRGAAHVTEYDPHRGMVRGWRESYDHNGNVNRVHPKMINGKNIKALHYPHTGKELAEIAAKMKGK